MVVAAVVEAVERVAVAESGTVVAAEVEADVPDIVEQELRVKRQSEAEPPLVQTGPQQHRGSCEQFQLQGSLGDG